MCMMQAPVNRRQSNVRRYKKEEKKEATHFDKTLMKADPNFIDERKTEIKEKRSFFSKLLDF